MIKGIEFMFKAVILLLAEIMLFSMRKLTGISKKRSVLGDSL